MGVLPSFAEDKDGTGEDWLRMFAATKVAEFCYYAALSLSACNTIQYFIIENDIEKILDEASKMVFEGEKIDAESVARLKTLVESVSQKLVTEKDRCSVFTILEPEIKRIIISFDNALRGVMEDVQAK